MITIRSEKFVNKYIGKKIYKLTILENLGIENGKSIVKTECECGNISNHRLACIIKGKCKSCGCLKKPFIPTHGLSKHPIHGIWCAMKQRCYDTKFKHYKRYGAVGVKVCDEWLNNFHSFYTWAIENGWRKGLFLDKDIKGNKLLYSPENCLFVTREQNNNHTKRSVFINYNGHVKNIKEWSVFLNIPYTTMRSRVYKLKWSIERAFTEPIKQQIRC